MAFDGLTGSANNSSSDELANIHLDFDTLLSTEHALNPGLGPYEPCIHDDACLHFTQPSKAQAKSQGSLAQTPPARSSRTLARNHPRINRAEHGRAKSQVDRPCNLDHIQDYSWENMFNENALNAYSMQTHGGLGVCQDDDCVSVSCSSACEGSCPSQCGETSHAVCCDDDACASPNLCVDEHCKAASQPCTDENCVVDSSLSQRQPHHSPAISDGDKAAAAALASFGGNNLEAVQNGFAQQPQHTSTSRDGLVNFENLPHSLPCGSLSMDAIFANMNGHPSFPNQPLQMAFEYALASHIMQHHDPSHGLANHGSCVANDPSQLITRCTLPKFTPSGMTSTDPFLPQLQPHECGFQVQDPNEFAHHIFQEHRPMLMTQANPYGFPDSSHTHGHLTSPTSHQHQSINGPYFNYNAATASKDFSPSMSPLTSLSMGPSLSATPVSLPTPSPLDYEQSLPGVTSTADAASTSTETEPQAMTQEDQLMCRWLLKYDDRICGQRFENDEQLQRHCKHDHLKQLKKVNGGFRCGWANCTRNTCFTQRSKVERHLQVHTGYKPVQCTICGAALSAKQALDQHMRIHTGETPWVCKYPGCDCAFKQQSALTMHERTHTGDKPLECEICGKRFSESSNLSKHRRTHNVKGMHECQLCGKDFHRLDQLRRHMGTTHKDRPAEVDALLSEAKGKIKANKVSKLKKVKVKGMDGKAKPELLLDLDDDANSMDMIEEPIPVAIQR
ncbi:Zinc finger, C2H2-type/integrase, DNA-binding protein [Metarhizium album ARSEF 1941]|uniref:Zinc finger, C2H2-type/integrase, DNA-binding protein n=1 Tax=Metarhizium album (strain ARSEF 1941) TaxID=1081103 RepID=A0A0B2X0S5_METAS|nr:Zinc finger, C2H2-type/integrase, DNA-binding protein [Metarhizium album ARSEF 1941]KHN99903.1 Zinc finger, C2H2-type/integrase, DNA-binding protein [Metarhizium album ARSEF 1941]